MPINDVNPKNLDILIEEQNMGTNKKKETRQQEEQRKECLRIALSIRHTAEWSINYQMFLSAMP